MDGDCWRVLRVVTIIINVVKVVVVVVIKGVRAPDQVRGVSINDKSKKKTGWPAGI